LAGLRTILDPGRTDVIALRALADGGLWLAAVKMWLSSSVSVGLAVDLAEMHPAQRLFCEEAGQFLLAVLCDRVQDVERELRDRGVSCTGVGKSIAGGRLQISLARPKRVLGPWSRSDIKSLWQSWEGDLGGARTS